MVFAGSIWIWPTFIVFRVSTAPYRCFLLRGGDLLKIVVAGIFRSASMTSLLLLLQAHSRLPMDAGGSRLRQPKILLYGCVCKDL